MQETSYNVASTRWASARDILEQITYVYTRRDATITPRPYSMEDIARRQDIQEVELEEVELASGMCTKFSNLMSL